VRTRYLAIKILSEQRFSKWDVVNTIQDAVIQLFGEYGASQANIYLVDYDAEKNLAVLRCSHKYVEMARAAIASLTKMGDHTVTLHVLGVSGTLRALRRRILEN
jgi:RNase P/RNase MRP subunit POP5